jgi:hypothetical protein
VPKVSTDGKSQFLKEEKISIFRHEEDIKSTRYPTLFLKETTQEGMWKFRLKKGKSLCSLKELQQELKETPHLKP